MNYRRAVSKIALGFSLASFITGVWKHDTARLSRAFLALGVAWVYREIDLGWSEEKKTWKFIPFRDRP